MSNIELSIIIPVYNVAPYLMRNYQSILEQDYENYEIIYVNDGSTDNSLSILRDIESSNDRVQVIDISLNGGGS